MAIKTEKCEWLGQTTISEQGGTPKYTTNTMYAGWDDQVDSGHRIGIMKFKTPNVPNFVSRYVRVKLPIVSYHQTTRLMYGLCSSDSNYKNYYKGYGAIEDENQFASATFPMIVNDKACWFTINTENLKPNTVYYLFLWAASYQATDAWIGPNSYIEIAFDYCVARIDNGSVFELYQCFIDNGTSWDLYMIHIDNGTSWDIYS